MNFRISSAPDQRLSDEDYVKFKEDYLHSSLNWNELKNKYGLSKKEHAETCRRVKQEEGLTTRPSQTARYFYRTGSYYKIIKRINGVNIIYGKLSTDLFDEEDLKRIVEKCKEFNWDLERCKTFIEQTKFERRNVA